MKILIVDDDPLQTRILVDIFKASNYCVKGVETVGNALDMLKSIKFDVILSDIRMPITNGVEFCRIVKETNPAVYFILMTAYASDDLVIDGIRAGALVTLSKPLDIDNLLSRVSSLSHSFRPAAA